MAKVAWVLAVLTVVGAFIVVKYTRDSLHKERTEAQKALSRQRDAAERAVEVARSSLDVLRNNYDRLAGNKQQAEMQYETVKDNWEELEQSIIASDRAIERLATEKTSAVRGRQEGLEEIKELQRKISILEKQITALNDMLPMVGIEGEVN